MVQLSQLKFAQPRLLLPGMAVALLPVGGVLADEVPEAAAGPAYEEVLVTGQNLSIQSSIEAKKTADVTIDVISADNLGKIPDATVADSLAHIPGRSISAIELLRPVLRRFFVTGCVMFQAPERSASDAVAACRSKESMAKAQLQSGVYPKQEPVRPRVPIQLGAGAGVVGNARMSDALLRIVTFDPTQTWRCAVSSAFLDR